MFPSQYLAKIAADEKPAAIDTLSGLTTAGGALVGGGVGKVLGIRAGQGFANSIFQRSHMGRAFGSTVDRGLEQLVNRKLNTYKSLNEAVQKANTAESAYQAARMNHQKLVDSRGGVFARIRNFFSPGSANRQIESAAEQLRNASHKAINAQHFAEDMHNQLYDVTKKRFMNVRDNRLGLKLNRLKRKFGRAGNIGGSLLGMVLGGGAAYAFSNPRARAAISEKFNG